MKRSVILAALVSVMCVIPLRAGDYGAVKDEQAFRRELMVKTSAVTSIQASFVQEKFLSVFSSTVKSEGKFYWEKETFTEAIIHKEFTNANCEYLIIPDWRYAQTKDYFEKVADKVIAIRITRPNLEKGTHDDHSSENDFLNFSIDMEAPNTRDLENLKRVAKHIVYRCCN